jgi:hypothetical protein
MARLKALRTSGRLSVIVRTAPSRLVSTSAIAQSWRILGTEPRAFAR